MDNTCPVVSIICLAFNHARFIKAALDGFLAQKTNFPIEVIIQDDQSSDDTVNIIRSVFRGDPRLRLIVNAENIYSKGGNLFEKPFREARGKYLAICEGDDFWTDALKLQRQVDFLEDNAEYVACYHDVMVVDESGARLEPPPFSLPKLRDYSPQELCHSPTLFLATLCFRHVIREFPPEYTEAFGGDRFLTSMLGSYGLGKYIDGPPASAYRIHTGGVWSGLSEGIERQTKILSTRRALLKYHSRMGNREIAQHFRDEILALREQLPAEVQATIDELLARLPLAKAL